MGIFPYRPWVRRAGLSIVVVAAIATVLIGLFGYIKPAAAFGWAREPFVWAYIGALWLGGAKVYLGTLGTAAELSEHRLLLRPLHQLRPSTIEWSAMLGTEQMIGGDRLIVYHETKRGMRFVAMNLNLVKGRREFLTQLDQRLRAMGFAERVVERSRYLSRPA
jgi:hypothetical protein